MAVCPHVGCLRLAPYDRLRSVSQVSDDAVFVAILRALGLANEDVSIRQDERETKPIDRHASYLSVPV